jgi:uncharacterized protein YndB with AHSA1/START domain
VTTEATEQAGERPGRQLVMTRVFDAPRALVWKAWTDSVHLARWWGPRMFTNPVCEVDPRPGGAIRIHMQGPDGSVYPMSGTFVEVVEPERLIYTAGALHDESGTPGLETHNTVTFDEHDGKTTLTQRIVVTRATAEAADALAGMEIGWSQSLDRLAELLAQA